MRKIAVATIALFLFALSFGAPAITHAAGALCWADSYALAQGESTGVYCTGFSPLTWVNVYYAEPDGTAVYYADVKSDADGNVAFGWGNGIKNLVSLGLGTYKLVVQQLGPGEAVVYAGTVEIKSVGDGGHVSGAYLSADKSVVDRTSEAVTITGWGFAPGEVVSFWMQRPYLCSSYTYHYVDGKNGATFENFPAWDGFGTFPLGDLTADVDGAVGVVMPFGSYQCEGTYRVVARGNSSGWGAYVEFAVSGPSVSTNAWLVPSKESVGAFNDTIEFDAYGFGANEILNCYTTSPDGRAIPYGVGGSLAEIRVGADGIGTISLTTGSYIVSPDDPFYFGNSVSALMSEGSLGVWKMTCKGLGSGTTAIAEYTVHGYELNP